jgi:hypothetical protein
VFDTLIQRTNIYGIDNFSNPVDLHKNINMYQTNLPLALPPNESFYFRTRYRDNNLKWSNWSASWFFTTTGLTEISVMSNDNLLFQNFPNPFKNQTTIKYELKESSEVIFRFFDIYNKIIFDKHEGFKPKGIHAFTFYDEKLKSGTYFCEMISGNKRITKAIVKIE